MEKQLTSHSDIWISQSIPRPLVKGAIDSSYLSMNALLVTSLQITRSKPERFFLVNFDSLGEMSSDVFNPNPHELIILLPSNKI